MKKKITKNKEERVCIDLAAGQNKKEGFTGIDISDVSNVDIVHDLNIYPWPIEDNSVDEIHCSHYIEHIPHDIKNNDSRDGFIQFMDEVYRVLKPGGKATFIAPYYTSMRAYGDPTDKRYISDMSFYYYNKAWRDANKLDHYGINCDFDMTFEYFITNDLSLKSKEVRDEKIKHSWNVIDDIIAKLVKR
jgi:predicted SAM-dependent methyltransferase